MKKSLPTISNRQAFKSKYKDYSFVFRVRGATLLTLELLLGVRTIMSLNLQSNTSQIKSSCSRLTLSVISWYKSLIVFGRIWVARDKSICVHLRSPSSLDNKILNRSQTPLDKYYQILLNISWFWYKISKYDKWFWKNIVKYRFCILLIKKV